MDHKAWIKGLPDADKERLTARRDAPALAHLLAHAGLIVLCGGLIAARVPLWWLLLLPQGLLLSFLFTLQHEATHKTPFASARLNEWVGHATGFVIVQPFLWFRYFHLAHHRFTNLPGKDPELDAPKPEGAVQLAWHLSTVDYWLAKMRTLAVNAFGRPGAAYLPQAAQPRIRREARWMLAGYGGVLVFSLTVSPVLLWCWLIPLALGFPFLRLYLLAEHGRCPQVANMFANTRTTFTNGLVHFLAWNMPYHVEHHVFPQVPYHQLPTLHVLIRSRLQVTAPGYLAFARAWLDGPPPLPPDGIRTGSPPGPDAPV